MTNKVLLIAVAIILLSLSFILYSFIPVATTQLDAAIDSSEQVFTWATIAVGAITALLYYAFGTTHRILGSSVGVIIFIIGLLLFLKPAFGNDIVNILLAVLLFGSGLFKLSRVPRITVKRLKWLTIVSALVSIGVACIAVIYFFGSAKYELITFLAIDIFVSGFILLHLAFSDRQA